MLCILLIHKMLDKASIFIIIKTQQPPLSSVMVALDLNELMCQQHELIFLFPD